MNTPEKIVNTYFRLNGFFLLPQFTIFANSQHIHVDLLALRPAGSQEICEGNLLPIDNRLFTAISELAKGDATQSLIGAIAEIKGNNDEERPLDGHIAYARNFFGPDVAIIPISVSTRYRALSIDQGCLLIPLNYALGWTLYRFRWMDQNLRHLTKTGSWNWSEDDLADLLYLQKIGFAELDNQAIESLNPKA